MKKTFIMESHNFIPPTTEGQARYYWFQPRNIRPQDETLSKMMNEDAQHACEEDRAVLNAIQLGMSNKSSPHINLPIDGGRLHFCRQLQVMINEERQVDKQTAV